MSRKAGLSRMGAAATLIVPVMLTASGAVHAQANSSGAGVTPSGQSSGGNGTAVQEIVVTALKRSESVLATPAAVTAFDAKTLENRRIANLNDIQLATPDVSVGTALGTTQISIRGVGLTIATGAGEPGVATYLDGVYEARPALSNLAQFDLQRIEVLRGPQGTLYGRNATGGAVNFISNAPTNTFQGDFRIGYAEYNEFHTEGVLSGPLTDSIRARVGVTFTNRADGFLKNIDPGQEDPGRDRTFGTRGRLTIDLAPKATLDLGLTFLKETGGTVYFTPSQPLDPTTVAFNPALQGALSSFSPYTTAQDTPKMSRTAYSPTATFTWDIGSVRVRSVTGFSAIDTRARTDADGTSAHMGILPNAYRSREVTEDLNLSGKTGGLDWLLGAYYLHENYKAYQDVIYPNGFVAPFPIPGVGVIPIPVFAPGDQTYQHWRERRQSYAAYADATYHFSSAFALSAGGRYSYDDFGLTQSVGTLPNPLSCTDLTTDKTFSSFTPRLSAQYTPTRNDNLYGTVSEGYKSGGVNFGTCGNVFKPERLTAFEIGYKKRLLGDSLSFSLAGFYYRYRDLQVYQLLPISEGGGSQIGNAPRATVKGFEADGTWNPEYHIQINANVGFLDARYDEYTNADSSILGAPQQDLAGHNLPKSPHFTGSFGAQYVTDDIASFGRITLRGEIYHSASQSYTEFAKPQDIQKAYTIGNLYLTWESLDRKYVLRAYAKNVSDQRYFDFVTASPLSGTTLVTYAPPRQVGAELEVRF